MWRSMGRLLSPAIVLAGVLPVAGLAAQSANNFQILYQEPVMELRFDGRAAGDFLAQNPRNRPAAMRATFAAMGKHFELDLESNNRLVAGLAAKSRDSILGQYSLLKGKLTGIEDSWVRLTASGETVTGVVWDGFELYAIEPAASVQSFAVQPVTASGDNDPVIYRWSDTLLAPGMQFCGVTSTAASTSAIEQYNGMVQELRQTFQTSLVPTSEINVGVLADFEAFQFFGGTMQAMNAMITRMNVVDGIYSDQVGVQINITENIVFDQANDPFSDTDEPGTLLEELSFHKLDSTSGLADEGLAHLFTGRDLMGTTVGVAFMGAVCPSICQPQQGNNQLGDCASGITESRSGPTVDGLIAAHEIGHNFNAPHDAEPGSPCETTLPGFLMEASFNGSSSFSQCSLDEIAPTIAAANCLTPIAAIDLEVLLPVNPINRNINDTFDYQIRVRNVGSEMATTNSVNVTLDNSLTFLNATGQQGVCTTSAGGIDCPIADLAGGAEQMLTLTVRATQAGSFPSNVSVTTMSSDSDLTNNAVTATINITDPQAGSGGGSGGGALGLVLTLLLTPLAARRKVCNR